MEVTFAVELTTLNMDTRIKADLEDAIQKVLNDGCEHDAWSHFIHPELVKQMANAAELIFDASQDAQSYFEQEMG